MCPGRDDRIVLQAADVLVLPYARIFQSGVLFLGYNFGLPVIASDVASLREEIIEGKPFRVQAAGFGRFSRQIDKYFDSELFRDLESREVRSKRTPTSVTPGIK